LPAECVANMSTTASDRPDVALIGAGIMSATLGTLLKELEPTLDVVMFETLGDCAQESSEAWNNAGTGHAANCELNYTPQRSDGSVDISKALEVNTEFDISRQLWSHLVTTGAIPDPSAFLEGCPHLSFVWGEENVAFLRTRYEAMSAHHCYEGMEYSEDHGEIADWADQQMRERAIVDVGAGDHPGRGHALIVIAPLHHDPRPSTSAHSESSRRSFRFGTLTDGVP